MKSIHVLTLISWLQRLDDSYSVLKLFEGAYYHYHGVVFEKTIRRDVVLFSQHKHVPYYVQRFVREMLYPKLLFLFQGSENQKKTAVLYYFGEKK